MKQKVKQDSGSNKTKKKTRGYRLKPETHAIIGKIQEFLQSDQDEAIASACSKYYKELQRKSSANNEK